MFLTPAVPRLNNENANVIAKKTPNQGARRAFGDIPVNVKNTASPAFSKLNAQQKILKKPMAVKIETPKSCVLPQFDMHPYIEDNLEFPSFNEPEDDYSDIRPVGEMENNIKNMMFSYNRDTVTPPPLEAIQSDWKCDKLELLLMEESKRCCYEDMLDRPLKKPSYLDVNMSLPEIDDSFDLEL